MTTLTMMMDVVVAAVAVARILLVLVDASAAVVSMTESWAYHLDNNSCYRVVVAHCAGDADADVDLFADFVAAARLKVAIAREKLDHHCHLFVLR